MKGISTRKPVWALALAVALAAAIMVPAAAWADDLQTGSIKVQGTGDLTPGTTTSQTYDTDYTSPTGKKGGQCVADGTYALVAASDAGALRKVVGVKGNSKSDKANVNLQPQKANKAQKWTITYSRKSGAYVIVNAGSKMMLSVKKAKNGGNVYQTKNRATRAINFVKFPKSQLWTLTATKTGYKIASKAKSSLVLSVKGNNIAVTKSNNKAAQRFWLANTDKWKRSNILQNGHYTLRPKGQDQVLGLASAVYANGTKFKVAKDQGELTQAFEITHVGSGKYKIAVVATGKALTAAGKVVEQRTYSGSNAQKWTAQLAADGSGIVFTCKNGQLGFNGTNATVGTDATSWAVSPTTTKYSNMQLRGLSKANQYGGRSQLAKKDDCYYYIVLDRAGHEILLYVRDDTDELWELEDQWKCSTMGHDTIQYRALKKHPNLRTTGTVRDENPDPYGSGYSAYYWTHIGYGSWFHSTLYRPGSKSTSDGRLGYSISNGCIRNPIAKAKWLNKHIAHVRTGVSVCD